MNSVGVDSSSIRFPCNIAIKISRWYGVRSFMSVAQFGGWLRVLQQHL